MQKIAEMAETIKRLESLVYVPGHWKCAKCDLYLASTNLHADSGGFSANNQPRKCANGCGPMWRVTERDAGNRMIDAADLLTDDNTRLRASNAVLVAALKLVDEWGDLIRQNYPEMLFPAKVRAAIAKAEKASA